MKINIKTSDDNGAGWVQIRSRTIEAEDYLDALYKLVDDPEGFINENVKQLRIDLREIRE